MKKTKIIIGCLMLVLVSICCYKAHNSKDYVKSLIASNVEALTTEESKPKFVCVYISGVCYDTPNGIVMEHMSLE